MATGKIAGQFAETIQKMADQFDSDRSQQVLAVASRTQEKADQFAAEHGIARAYAGYEKLAEDPDIDAIYIALPNLMHDEAVRLCIKNHKHVLCEKPLTTSRAESEALYQLAEAEGVLLLEGFWVAFLPLYEKLRQVIRDGVIGDITSISCHYGFISSGPRRLTKLKPELGGGGLMDIGIYVLGFLWLVLEEVPVIEKTSAKLCEFGTDIACDMTLRCGNVSISADLTLEEVRDRVGVISGTKGTITLPDFQHAESFVISADGADPVTVTSPEEINGFEYEIRAFTEAAAEKKTSLPAYTAENSLALMGLMDDIRAKW